MNKNNDLVSSTEIYALKYFKSLSIQEAIKSFHCKIKAFVKSKQ